MDEFIMAKRKGSNGGNKVATDAAAVEVSEVVETIEQVEAPVVIEQTDAVVIDAPADLTETSDEVAAPVLTCSDCGTGFEVDANGVANFSMLLNGKYRNICKGCQTLKSIAWTTAKADYRKEYARANQLLNRGIPVIVPNARDWKAGDVLMTVEYALLDGKSVPVGTEGATVFPSRPAEEVYAEQVAERKALAQAQRDEQAAIIEAAREQARAERDAAKAERDRVRAEQAATLKAERDAAKAEALKVRAEQAEAARLERERVQAEKAEQRKQDALAKAAQIEADRTAKALARAEAQRQKALDRATAAANATAQKNAEATAKALAALKGTNA